METLFNGSTLFIYLFFCVGIFCYDVIQENQKVILVYIVTVALSFYGNVSPILAVGFVMGATFLYLEFFIQDSAKFKYISSFKFKIIDYLLLFFIQFSGVWIVASVILVNPLIVKYMQEIVPIGSEWEFVYYIPGFWLLAHSANKILSRKFEIKSVDEIMKKFEPEIYRFTFDDEYQNFFDILVEIEDKSYLERGDGYNIVSRQFWCWKFGKILNIFLNTKDAWFYIKRFFTNNLLLRGYSTIEMQLIRSIGISDDYDRYEWKRKLKRKIFEICYTKILFTSLSDYFDRKTYTNRGKFKEYLLLIYVQSVNTRVGGIKHDRMLDFFSDQQSLKVKDWNKEAFFVACLGLNHQPVFSDNIDLLRPDLVEIYGLDSKKIKQIVVEKEINDK